MVKGLNCYNGCAVLGYRVSLPRLMASGYARSVKSIGSRRVGINNNIYCLKKVQRTSNK